MGKEYTLGLPQGYRPETQAAIGALMQTLEMQTEKLRTRVTDLTVGQLEWQPGPGHNTIGMLLAHNAVAEVFWIKVAAQGIPWGEEGDRVIRGCIGINGNDDGLPLKDGGGHPETLRDRTAARVSQDDRQGA